MTTELNGIQFDLEIDGSDIIAKSLTQDIFFKDGADMLNAEADDAWYKAKRNLSREDHAAFMDYPRSQWIAEYIDENIEQWVKNNLALGKVETYHLN